MAKTVKQKEINFLNVLLGRSAKKKLDLRTLIMPGLVLAMVLVGVGVFAILYANTAQVEAQSNTIREYLNAPDTTQQLAESVTMESQAQEMQARAKGLVEPMENLAGYPDLTSDTYRFIFDSAGLNIELHLMSYDRSTGILSFTATSQYVLSIPTYISQLRSSGIFVDVTYSGYAGDNRSSQLGTSTSRGSASAASNSSSGDTSGGTSTPAYAFSIECSVKPVVAQTEES